jgi:hypothetical protein
MGSRQGHIRVECDENCLGVVARKRELCILQCYELVSGRFVDTGTCEEAAEVSLLTHAAACA